MTIHLQAAQQTKRHVGQGAVNVFVIEVDALLWRAQGAQGRVA
jgi:hypothetical protein